jgi:hypothetical protein
MKTEPHLERGGSGYRQPSLVVGPEMRRIDRKLQDAGILCQPEISIQYQTIAKRAVVRGVESGGSNKDMGRYVTFCSENGEAIPWLQPMDTVATNGRHAVVIARAFVSVDVFRMRNTYDVLIARHQVIEPEGARGRIESSVVFRGRQGYLPLDLTGAEKNMAGQILPEFFNKAGEPIEIPAAFVGVVKAAVRGANCLGCTHQHYVTAPKVVVAATVGASSVDATEQPGAFAESA